MPNDTATSPTSRVEVLAAKLADDLATLDRELGEVDLLVNQATTEAARHESRRAAAADKLGALPDGAALQDRLEQMSALVSLTKRASLMETQVEVLDGKRRALTRYRDAIAAYIDLLEEVNAGPATPEADGAGDTRMDPAVARLLMSAQEDLRREIARAMHDGPAQSLTNIVLQAQIVERMSASDPEASAYEVRQLVSMVQQTLDATKTFIFDVRPMVLDDLGLVPTLRRATRERGRRTGIPVEFESMGHDRRLPMELESALFRVLDEALAGYLGAGPDGVSMRLDWSERFTADVRATRAAVQPTRSSDVAIPDEEAGRDLPPALAALVEERRSAERAAAEAARRASIVMLPPATWREIQDRAASVGVDVELQDEGARLHIAADMASDGNDDRADT